MIKQKLCRKIVGTILLVSTLLLAYFLYLCTPTTNAESCNTAAAIATDYSIKENFSEYTDNELPESINADNILQVVPAELFNKNETSNSFILRSLYYTILRKKYLLYS